MSRYFARCPFCNERVPVHERKDEESFTLSEVDGHLSAKHVDELKAFQAEHGPFLPFTNVWSDAWGPEP